MRKYWQVFKNYFQERLEYRLNIFWRVAGTLIWTPIMFALWATVLNSGFGADKYNFHTLAVYYISVAFISLFIASDQNHLALLIRRGDLAGDLLKPYSFFTKFFLTFLPEKLILFVIFIMSLSFIGFTGNLPLALISCILAIFIRFYIAILIGSLAFWIKRVHGINSLLFHLGGLFSGSSIPTDLLPKNLLAIADVLPFKYTIFVPAQFFSHQVPLFEAAKVFLVQGAWIALLYFLTRLVWSKGIKQFEASGN